MSSMFPPGRIVRLTEEKVETLYVLATRTASSGPPAMSRAQARREKPRMGAFTSANIDKIVALKPDFVFGVLRSQVDIAADLIRRRLDVHAFNQRSVAGILEMIRTLGAIVDASKRTRQLVGRPEASRAEVGQRAECLPRQPKVSFEEWNDCRSPGWVGRRAR